MTSSWYRRIFPTRLAAHRQAVQEFVTTRQGYRLATSTGGVLTGRGAICRLQRFCGSYDPEQHQSGLDSGLFLDSRQAGFGGSCPLHDRGGGILFLASCSFHSARPSSPRRCVAGWPMPAAPAAF
jgi:hypothetical protein